MKNPIKKAAKLFIALVIPMAFLAGCQDDSLEVYESLPPKSEVKLPPGSNKE